MRVFEWISLIVLASIPTQAISTDDSFVEKALQQRASLLLTPRQRDLAFCWSKGGICDVSTDLSDQCDGLHDSKNLTAYVKCRCENGYLATSKAYGHSLNLFTLC